MPNKGSHLSAEPVNPDPAAAEAQARALLDALAAGGSDSSTALFELLYRDLRAIAGSYFQGGGAAHTLQPTALVHDAFVRLIGSHGQDWESRAHFVAVAAKAMRQILIDHTRAKRAAKRGGGAARVTLTGAALDDADQAFDALDLDEALRRLAAIEERQARIVEMRFFAGMSVREIALVLGVSERTVELDWRLARAWLRRELKEASA